MTVIAVHVNDAVVAASNDGEHWLRNAHSNNLLVEQFRTIGLAYSVFSSDIQQRGGIKTHQTSFIDSMPKRFRIPPRGPSRLTLM